MRAAAFVRRSGASGLGHLGWSFDFDLAQINAGSVENPRGTPTCDPDNMGYWDIFCDDPIPAMVQKSYDALKYFDIADGDPSAAYAVAQWIKTQPYSVLGRNCLDDAYDILRSYGVRDLPPPSHDWIPNAWFDRVGATSANLVGFKWSDRPQGDALSLVTVPLKEDVFAKIFPLIPTWRQVGSGDWYDLQDQLAAASASPYVQQHVAMQ